MRELLHLVARGASALFIERIVGIGWGRLLPFGLAGWPHWQEPIYLLGAISGLAGALAFRAIWRPLINPAQPLRP